MASLMLRCIGSLLMSQNSLNGWLILSKVKGERTLLEELILKVRRVLITIESLVEIKGSQLEASAQNLSMQEVLR